MGVEPATEADRRVGESLLGSPLARVAAWAALSGLVARILYWVLVTPDWMPASDSTQYLEIAENVANGDGFSLVFPQMELHATAFRPPLYPLLIAPLALVFGDALWPYRVFSLVLGLGVIVLAVAYVGRFVSPRAAAVTGLAVALYPPLIANDTVALTESLSLLLLLAVLLALDAKRPVWCGVCMGLLLLARPNAYVIVVIVVVFLVWTVGWRRTGWFVVATLLCIAPWMVRNQIQIGSPRLTTSEGFNLAAIYSPRAQERGEFVDPAYDDAYRDDIALKLTQFDEAVWNAHLTEMGIEGLRENPGYLRYLVGENLRSYFELEPSNNDWAEEVDGRNLDFRNATLPLFYMVTIGGLVGFALNLRRRRLWPALLVTAQFIVLSVLLIAVPRLRSPFDLFMCIGLGLLVQWVIDRRIRRATSAPPDRSVGSESSPSIAASEHR